jgi:hypothetical protein
MAVLAAPPESMSVPSMSKRRSFMENEKRKTRNEKCPSQDD